MASPRPRASAIARPSSARRSPRTSRPRPGDGLLLRIETDRDIPGESLYGRRESAGRTIRLTCGGVASPQQLGEFALRPGQGTVFSVFVPLKRLQRDLAQPSRVERGAVRRRIAGRPAAAAPAGAPRAGVPVGRRPAPPSGDRRGRDVGRERARPAGRRGRWFGVRRGARGWRAGVRRAGLPGQRHPRRRTRDPVQRGGRRRSRAGHADRRPAGGRRRHESRRGRRERVDLAERVGLARSRRPDRSADRHRVLPLGERRGPRDEARDAPPGRCRGH